MARPSPIMLMACVVCLLAHQASAVCCKRKASFGCCGNGPCNIFCCNCDNGCNQQCKNTHCNTGEWLKCGVLVTRCAAACGGSLGAGCAACMGSSFDGCSKCYANGRRKMLGMTSISTVQDRNDFFASISGGNSGITLPKFTTWMQHAHGNITRTGAAADKTGILTPDQVFRSFDVNADGIISRREFDNKGVTIGWRDIRFDG